MPEPASFPLRSALNAGLAANTKERLASGVTLLALVDRRRRQTGLPHLGANIERLIILRELEELETLASVSSVEEDGRRGRG